MQCQMMLAYSCTAGGAGESSAQASASSTCAWPRSSRRAVLMHALAPCIAASRMRARLWNSTMLHLRRHITLRTRASSEARRITSPRQRLQHMHSLPAEQPWQRQ